jgi:hypothetical protein
MRLNLVRIRALIVSALIVAFFFYNTWFGLFIGLGYDDVMNITFAWEPPLPDLLRALLVPFTSFYRPTGSAVYRLLFEIFGLDPMPFRIFTYSLLLLNVFLVYKLVARLSGSREIGAMAALLFTYHGRLSPIYLNNGTIYDILCGTLMLGLFLYYDHVRGQGRDLNWKHVATLTLLFVLALNAKEMAGAVPILLFAYELIFFSPAGAGRPQASTLLRRLAIPIGFAVITGLAASAKMGAGSVMHSTPPYAMTVSLHQFLDHWCRLVTDLIYKQGRPVTDVQLFLVWLTVCSVTLLLRKRYVTFLAAWALLAPLPVIFIPFRGFFVMYVPLIGWAGLLAAFLIEGRDWLFHFVRNRPTLQQNAFEPVRIVQFALVAVLMTLIPRSDVFSFRTPNDPGQAVIGGMTRDILGLDEPLPAASRVLFLHDRFPADAWGTVMICRLLYDDRHLWADRPTMMDRAPDESSYDRVFDYINGRVAVVKSRTLSPEQRRSLRYPE